MDCDEERFIKRIKLSSQSSFSRQQSNWMQLRKKAFSYNSKSFDKKSFTSSLANFQRHICPICELKFKNGQGLGGHMSRVHQGQSATYQRKIQVREGRTFDRLMFKYAKHFHDIHYRMFLEKQSNTDENLDRAYIRRWKTKIYKYLECQHNITQKTFFNFEEDSIF